MTDDLIDRAKAALEGVTEGPWSTYGSRPYEVFQEPTGEYEGEYIAFSVQRYADAAFIAAARSLMPELLAEVERLRGALDQTAIDANHIGRQRAFSEATFGPGRRTEGVVDHIRKELLEVLAAPDDLAEWVDVIILGLDGAWRTGADPQAIIEAIKAKQTQNEQRNWPDWRTAKPGEAIEHIRELHDKAAVD